MHRSLALAIQSFRAGLDSCRRAEDRLLVERYLAELGPILAGAILGESVLARIPPMERLLGNSCLLDKTPFVDALKHWQSFREEYESFVLGPMTVNERLFALSLSEAYDVADQRRDLPLMTSILRRARIDEDSIRAILGRTDR